ncbi:glycosyltransferase family 2 protein [Pedobacter ureilyticus]|uniref:Glycosyltransferase family 2 protein n=1 Tax=Pedobacter ureilyticus TaxID=1393051 RepID=A0ABW9J9X6_9SPHI|nr:glycosyltransferase [Pedobacter helvus]
MDISVVTIVKQRQNALYNLIKGIKHSTHLPAELIIVHMNEPIYQVPKLPIPIRQITCSAEGHLPLAEARNLAMRSASSEYVVFLDVDCIPSNNLIGIYKNAFLDRDILWSGRVRYLDEAAMRHVSLWERMHGLSNPDPIREHLESFSYELFWSLNFGCSKRIFDTIGGFDENFSGYGAEDTDFSFSARAAGVCSGTSNAMAYHQHHPNYSPPLNHFADIIRNAEQFRKKWGTWPMEGWLNQFEDMQLLIRGDDQLQVIRYPDRSEIAAAMRS